jgi:AraC-like DNA-binding protein
MQLQACGLLGGAYERHSHFTYEFHYVVDGRGSFDVGSRTLAIGPGDFFYTRPRTTHRSVLAATGGYLLQYLGLFALEDPADRDAAADLEARFGEGTIRRLGDRYHGFFAELARLSQASDPYLQRAATFRFAGLLYEAMGDAPVTRHAHPAVERALEFMRAHVETMFTLDALVTALGIEKSYFIRLFKKSVGMPPMKYAMHLKMSAAAELLRGGVEPQARVAARVGFADPYHFAKCFRQWSGTAPGRYRHGRWPPCQ